MLITLTPLSNQSPELFILKNWSRVPLKQHLPIFLHSIVPSCHHFTFCSLWVWLLYVPHISEVIQLLSFWYCLISFSIIPSRFPGSSAGKESACNAGDLGLIRGLGRSPGEWKGYPLQNSGLENSMDCIVHGVTKSQTPLSNFHFPFL